jgi:hypothetical protein
VLGVAFAGEIVAEYVMAPGDRELKAALSFALWFMPALAAVLAQRLVLKERFQKWEFGIDREKWPYYLLALLLVPLAQFLAYRFGALFGRQYVLSSSLEPLSEIVLHTAFMFTFGLLPAMGQELGWKFPAAAPQPRASVGLSVRYSLDLDGLVFPNLSLGPLPHRRQVHCCRVPACGIAPLIDHPGLPASENGFRCRSDYCERDVLDCYRVSDLGYGGGFLCIRRLAVGGGIGDRFRKETSALLGGQTAS